MSVFPQTFTKDKPIYYPSTWGTGKTGSQVYEEWKLSLQYAFLSNLLQCVIAGTWVWFVSTICNGIYEMWKLHRLDDQDRNKIANRQYISKKFIMRIGFISCIVVSATIFLLTVNEFTRHALVKGYLFYIATKWIIKLYNKVKQAYGKWKINIYHHEKVYPEYQSED